MPTMPERNPPRRMANGQRFGGTTGTNTRPIRGQPPILPNFENLFEDKRRMAVSAIPSPYRQRGLSVCSSGSSGSRGSRGTNKTGGTTTTRRVAAQSRSSLNSVKSFACKMESIDRLVGGANDPSLRKVDNVITSPRLCKKLPPIPSSPCTDVNYVNLKLTDSKMDAQVVHHTVCDYYEDPPKSPKFKTKGTQSLYRESSAQTLPMLPQPANKKEQLEDLEIYKLSKILPGEGPPGLYEVEVLERARKRWKFIQALKENFQRQMDEAHKQAKLSPHRNVIEAFEWEHWIEREEYINRLQMMRLEIVIRMFDRREKEMHDNSKVRIEQTVAMIDERRQKALRKNDIEYNRTMRRLEMKRLNQPRNWRKENITNQLGDPRSEFYAPQMRYGVSPARRHFVGVRKEFDRRIDNLEKKSVDIRRLECPFAKLKQWSKPKERFTEIEQNFCSEVNLMNLYETLKSLRLQFAKQKAVPKCLIKKDPVAVRQRPKIAIQAPPPAVESVPDVVDHDNLKEEEGRARNRYLLELQEESRRLAEEFEFLLSERMAEERENMINSYQGTTIGHLMRFLSQEMFRLQELRKIHFLIMLSQKERWRREAAEAGLRQKENRMREFFENLYQDTDEANVEVCDEFLNEIFAVDLPDCADKQAEASVMDLGRIIDNDIKQWLESFKVIQNPLNFDMLRRLLRNLVVPDPETIIAEYEKRGAVDYVINDVLLPQVFTTLEPYDISQKISNNFVDRLLDTDLYLFSSDDSDDDGEDDNPPVHGVSRSAVAKKEARAILRKLIRYSVPGRRWRTENEQIGDENVKDIFDQLFQLCDNKITKVIGPKTAVVQTQRSHFDLFNVMPDLKRITAFIIDKKVIDQQRLNRYTNLPEATITGKLVPIPSSVDLLAPDFGLKSGDLSLSSSSSNAEVHLNAVNADSQTKVKRLVNYLVKHVTNSFIAAQSGDSASQEFNSDEGISPVTSQSNRSQVVKFMITDIMNIVLPNEEARSVSEQSEPNFYEMEFLGEKVFDDNIEEQSDDTTSSTEEEVVEEIDKELDATRSGEEELDVGPSELKSSSPFRESADTTGMVFFITEDDWAHMNSDACKCQQEIEQENFVRNLMAQGIVQVMPRSETPKMFEYRTSDEDGMTEGQELEEIRYEDDNVFFADSQSEREADQPVGKESDEIRHNDDEFPADAPAESEDHQPEDQELEEIHDDDDNALSVGPPAEPEADQPEGQELEEIRRDDHASPADAPAEAEVHQPEADQPEANQPEANQPEADQPEADQPETDQPAADQPEDQELKEIHDDDDNALSAGPPAEPVADQPVKEEEEKAVDESAQEAILEAPTTEANTENAEPTAE